MQLWANSLSRLDLKQFVEVKEQVLLHLMERIQGKARLILQSWQGKVSMLEGSLQALNPLAVLDRGYAICRDPQGRILKDSSEMRPGDHFTVRLSKGGLDGLVERIIPPD